MRAADDPEPVVLIVGASSGIGKACARRLAARWRVYGTSRHAPAEGAVVAESDGRPPRSWRMLRMDVNVPSSVRAAASQLLAAESRLDAVVYCAGYGLAGPVEETSPDEARAQLGTNFFGFHEVLRAVLPPMRARHAGRIVVVGSVAGRIGLPFQAFYTASKFALEGLVEALAFEIGPLGIGVTLIEPGNVRTAFTANRQLARQGIGSRSAYATQIQAALPEIEREEHRGIAPEVVARTVARALEARRAPLRRLVGRWLELASIWIKAALPFSLYAALLRSHYKLQRRVSPPAGDAPAGDAPPLTRGGAETTHTRAESRSIAR